MSAPLDPTVLDMVRGSAFGSMLDRPVSDVLRDMGLPPFPALSAVHAPVPGLPPLPMPDLHALVKPLTDLAGGYGTGRLGTGGGQDPAQVLSRIGTALETAMSLGASAIGALMTLWQGQGAQAAAAKAGEADANGAELAAQGGQQQAVIGGAAASVATGSATMTAIIAQYLATLAAGAPLMATPGGQVFLIAATTEALTEALAQIAETKAELAVHAANMTGAGQKVQITAAPTGVGGGQDIQQLLQLVQPLLTVAQTGTQAAVQLAAANTSLIAPGPAATVSGGPLTAQGPFGDAGAGIGIDATVEGGIGGIAPMAAPLSAFPATGTAAASPASTPANTTETVQSASALRTGTTAAGPMLPLGGAAASSRAAADAGSGTPVHLVTARHGDEVVGALQATTQPVVGAPPHAPGPLPDKALAL